MRRLSRSLVLTSLLFAACGSSQSSAAEPEPAVTHEEAAEPGDATEEEAASDEAASPAPSYAVHEWGLVDVAPSGATELAAGPGQPPPTMSVRKPVLYVQLDPGLASLTFAARVQVPGGRIVEHWPHGELTADALAWPVVEARSCPSPASGAARDMPARELGREPARACDTPDGYCEVNDLPDYVAAGSACLRVGSEEGTLLFYRAAIDAVSLPLRVSRAADGSVSVEATRAIEASERVGALWRVIRDPGGSGRVLRADVPASGAVTLSSPAEAIDVARERGLLAQDLAALGLTPEESEAFLRAWTSDLFGAGGEARSARRASRARDTILYWLPRADVDRLAPLTLTPAPRELRRAILVRVEL